MVHGDRRRVPLISRARSWRCRRIRASSNAPGRSSKSATWRASTDSPTSMARSRHHFECWRPIAAERRPYASRVLSRTHGDILHTARPVSNGFRVFNIWTSEHVFEDFRPRLLDARKQAGVSSYQPGVEFYGIFDLKAPRVEMLSKLGATTLRAWGPTGDTAREPKLPGLISPAQRRDPPSARTRWRRAVSDRLIDCSPRGKRGRVPGASVRPPSAGSTRGASRRCPGLRP